MPHRLIMRQVFPARNLLKLAAVAAAGLALPRYTVAAEKAAPPKSINVLSPDAAFDRLIKGNTRYVNGAMKSHDFIAERPALVMGQNPFAGILSCADSRIAPEYAFDSGRVTSSCVALQAILRTRILSPVLNMAWLSWKFR